MVLSGRIIQKLMSFSRNLEKIILDQLKKLCKDGFKVYSRDGIDEALKNGIQIAISPLSKNL